MTDYAIIWTDEGTRRRHLAAVFAVSGPYTLAECHKVLDAAADAQDAGKGREYRARIVPIGDPFGIGNPWDLDTPAPSELEQLAEDDEHTAEALASHLARTRPHGDDVA